MWPPNSLGHSPKLKNEARSRAQHEEHRLKSELAFVNLSEATLEQKRDLTAFCMTQIDYGPSDKHGIELFASGTTPNGHSVCVVIHGFSPFFYVRRRDTWTDNQCAALLDALEVELRRQVLVGTSLPVEGDIDFEEEDNDDYENEDISAMSMEDAAANRRRKKSKKHKPNKRRKLNFDGPVKGLELEALRAQPKWIVQCESVAGAPFRSYIGKTRHHNYISIRLVSPKLVPLCRTLLEGIDGETASREWLTRGRHWSVVASMDLSSTFNGAVPHSDLEDAGRPTFELFEAHIEFVVRFLVEQQLRAASWWSIDMRVAKYMSTNRRSTCDYEICAPYGALASVPASVPGPRPGITLQNTLPNVLVLAFDLECVNYNGRFPSAAAGDEICIVSFSTYRLWNMDAREDHVFVRPYRGAEQQIDFTSLPAESKSVKVRKFDSEREMLLAFACAIVGIDPDVIHGFFSNVFDWNYLQERAKRLEIWHAFKQLGRYPNLMGDLRISQARVTRGRTKVDAHIGGRTVLDIWRWVTSPGPGKDFKDTRLNGVAYDVLGTTKVDMPPDRIAHFYKLNDATLGRLVWYASVDTQLLHELDKERLIVTEYLEQARCRCIPPQQVHDRGTEHSVQSAFLFFMQQRFLKLRADVSTSPVATVIKRLLIPTKRRDKPFIQLDKFEGAIVCKPKCAFYDELVITLDFTALYPSCMQMANMGPDTKIIDARVIVEEQLVEGVHYTRRPKPVLDARGEMLFDVDTKQPRLEPTSDMTSACYLTKSYSMSIVNEFLEYLGGIRSGYKKEMNAAIQALERLAATVAASGGLWTPEQLVQKKSLSATKVLMDIRQTQTKLLMNSTYGIFGSLTSPLSDIELASDVTWWGRYLSQWAGFLVQDRFSIKNGFSHDTDNVYGDTDSRFIHVIGLKGHDAFDSGIAWTMGEAFSKYVNAFMPKPHNLAFEKFFRMLLLRGKKMYAGEICVPGQAKPKFKITGMSVVKRDTTQLVQRVLRQFMETMIVKRSLTDAVSYARTEVGKLVSGEVRINELIQSKGLTSDPDKYKRVNKHGNKVTLGPHVQLALRMAAAEPNNPPRAGDRVSWVSCHTALTTNKDIRKQNKGDQTVSPMEAFKRRVPINVPSYLENLKRELIKVASAALGGDEKAEQAIFEGDHMRKRRRQEVAVDSPLAKFLKRTEERCEGCGTVLDARSRDTAPFCVDVCHALEARYRAEIETSFSEAEERVSGCLRKCQDCVLGEHATDEQRRDPAAIAEIETCASEACHNQWDRLQARKDLDEAARSRARLK